MHLLGAVGLLAATGTTGSGPPVTELVPVRPDAHDPSWPPVLIACVAAVVLGGFFAAVVFLRRARAATRPSRELLDD